MSTKRGPWGRRSAGQNEGGSDGLNSMMGMMVGPMADAMASHRIMTEKTDEFVDAMDIAGYNYMTGRHEMEHQIRPNRIVLGTETFGGHCRAVEHCKEQ